MEILILVCSIISIIFSIGAIALSLYVVVQLEAMKKSTHKLEYVPVKMPEFTDKQDREFKETLNEDFAESFIL